MHQISNLIQHYGLLFVFLSVLVDKIGVPLPSYPALLMAGALSVTGTPPVLPLILAATAGALTSDTAWYAIGRKAERRALALLCKISLSPDQCVRRTERLFSRFGPWTLLFAKFIPGLGYVSVALCGITRVNPFLFAALDAIGAAIYLAVPVVFGRLFHNAIDDTLATLLRLNEYGLALVLGLLACYLILRWINRHLFIRRLTMDRITVEELGDLVDKGLLPIILDVRPIESRVRDGIIPGSIGAHASEMGAHEKAYPLDSEIIVYCSCPNEASAALAAIHLKRSGFKKIRPLLGGIDAWVEAGRPIDKSLALERSIPSRRNRVADSAQKDAAEVSAQ
jgi:membrane protein DedA with SNARE-associated domain/rhodanese-related sulfurtransferase